MPLVPPASPARRRGFVFSSLLLILALLAVLAGLASAAAVAIIYPQLPPLDELTHYQPRQPLQVLTREGIEIAQFGSERREFLPLAQIPTRMQDILVAVEDVRFREHGGIDYRGIARALLANLAGRREGASTITQQVARNFYLSSRRTVERKLKEAALALKIEQQLSKDQILELYMNQIYLGQRAYGFGAAARVYFGKPLAECSVAEMAMLAGLPKNPSFANPITHFERATARQRVVLGRLLATGTITQDEHDAAVAQKLVVRTQGQTDVHAEYVAEMARREVFARLGDKAYTTGVKVTTSLVAAEQQAAWLSLRKSLLDHERRQPWRGPEDEVTLPDDADDAAIAAALKDSRDDEDLRLAIVLQASPRELTARLANGDTVTLSGDGLRLAQSGLGPKASDALRVQRGSIIRVAATAKGGWTIAQWPEAEGALVALDSATGRVRALVGGYDFARQPFNHATQAWRQPGSSFKPLLYSAALEQGVMPATRINDAPLTIGDWSPQNSDGQFDGPLTLRQALAKSKNLVSVRLLQQIGVPTVRDWAERFGLDRDKQPDNLTLALGAGSVTPMQMAAAYAVFANGGFKVTPRVIEKIVDAQGTVLYEAPAAPALVEAAAPAASGVSAAETASAPASAAPAAVAAAASAADGARVLPARNAFLTRALLQEVTRSGTAARAQATLKRPDVYGKTGTTNDAVDAWFAGFQPSIVAVVWIGYDEPRSLGARESGGGLALPAWLGYMQQALKGVPVAPDAPPEGVVSVDGDWRYAEFAGGGFVERIGLEAEPPPPAASAASTAASGP
ncbi:PBP1A family penicillin-binding protein [Ideonella sp. 4Y16]|uniref:penicillin-binding protein 1A n=1 Tax=Ideonella alba TaxID=2824118 RepID=UPI001B37D99C|nr:PBP1A family penicillin-binding protein [Ideonella alba]MBQ0942942.1 PBP1A family penicillin-binding protein [Ideonella alba]